MEKTRKINKRRVTAIKRDYAFRLKTALNEIPGNTQTVAAKLKVTERTVYNWLEGNIKSSINGRSLSIIQQLTGYSGHWITTGHEPRRIAVPGGGEPLVYNREIVERLPPLEKKRIERFIEMTLDFYAESKGTSQEG
jgi:hypothetical protein